MINDPLHPEELKILKRALSVRLSRPDLAPRYAGFTRSWLAKNQGHQTYSAAAVEKLIERGYLFDIFGTLRITDKGARRLAH